MKKNIILFLSILFVANVAIVSSMCAQEENRGVIFRVPTVTEPKYEGGQEAFRQYMELSIPQEIGFNDKMMYRSTSIFTMHIAADGTASVTKYNQIVGEKNAMLEEIMTEAISKMPKWTPSTYDEEPVESEVLGRMYYNEDWIIWVSYEIMYRINAE